MRKAAAGNLISSTNDPEGRVTEFTQYMPGSRHTLDRGQHLGANRVSTELMGIDLPVREGAAEKEFYSDLGFEAQAVNGNVRLSAPGAPGMVLELRSTHPGAQPQFLFPVDDARKAADELKNSGAKFDRLVAESDRQPDGKLKENPRKQPAPPKAFNGGGGLYSTAPDYVRFMQMILRRGRGGDGAVILQPKTVDMMATIQTGDLSAGKLKTARPAISSDVDFHPGFKDGFGFGFLINSVAYDGRRSAGSLAWAGIWNTYFWIDPKKDVAGVIMMQFLPFADKEGLAALGDFERAVYAS